MSLSLFFPHFKLCFLFNMKVFWFQNKQLKKHKFLVKRGVATKRFFYQPVFCKMSKVIVFVCPFLGHILVDVQESTIKIGISAQF